MRALTKIVVFILVIGMLALGVSVAALMILPRLNQPSGFTDDEKREAQTALEMICARPGDTATQTAGCTTIALTYMQTPEYLIAAVRCTKLTNMYADFKAYGTCFANQPEIKLTVAADANRMMTSIAKSLTEAAPKK